MTFINLARINQFIVHSRTVDEIERFFLEKARERTEAAVLLAGHAESEERFILDFVFIPPQTATMVDVELHPNSLKEISAKLPAMKRMFAIQMHTHPTNAFHSNTDNEDTTLQQHGCLSVVVPFFGVRGLRDQTGWAVFRRDHDVWCGPLRADIVSELLVMEA